MHKSRIQLVISCLAVIGAACGCSDDATTGSRATASGCNCTGGQICVNNTCQDNTDPCKDCTGGKVCIGNTCIDPSNVCDPDCTGGQICADKRCVDPGSICNPKCTGGKVCANNQCKTPSSDCDPECTGDETCVDHDCVLVDCDKPCGNRCCGDGQMCDTVDTKCRNQCDDGKPTCLGECCPEGSECGGEFGCLAVCNETQTLCYNNLLKLTTCCDAGYVCEEGECRIDCTDGPRCGNICCGAKEICDDGRCRLDCPVETGIRCGENEEFCCDNVKEVCLYHKCLAKGRACTTSNMCTFDEFCEESTLTCVNTDNVPSTCQVIPKFDTFSALQQWHWPKDLPGGVPSTDPTYIRVIVMPMAANMTDDNGDGVIDENDIPDVVFVAYSTTRSPDDQAPSVIRVISGDDAHEIASSAPRYWTYPLDAAIADVDDDGYPDIIAGTDLHHKRGSNDFSTGENAEYLEVLTVMPIPKTDPEEAQKYKLETKYRLDIPFDQKLSFISVANIDGEGTPEILTNAGIASVVEVDGVKKLQWRQGCENSNKYGYPHAADLDGDTIMEIVTNSAIYDTHCNLLTDGLSGGHVAIANLMPSADDAAETGELIPEIAQTNGGKGGGTFRFSKVYKKDNGDGTFTWSVKEVWRAPIPVDANRSNYVSAGCPNATTNTHLCNSGGGTPVIADFNDDGYPDVGVAARYYYIVYSNDGTPNGGKVLWADSKTIDYSSAVTGSSVFDFEGDGKAEVVYADEHTLHIYTGEGSGVDEDGDTYPDPVHLYSIPNNSATGYEYPIIVDVDNDGSTEIVVASDVSAETMGVRAFEDPGGQWVRTRRIWNQHFYHVTNINEDGSVPLHEEANWLHPKLNNYRQNVQPGGIFNAPNLVASTLTSSDSKCEDKKLLTLSARIDNKGSLGVKAGLPVKFYAQNANGSGKNAYLGTANVPTMLTPGSYGTATLEWDQTGIIDGETDPVTIEKPIKVFFVADEPTTEKERGEFVECIETDNQSDSVEIEPCKVDVN